MKYLTITSLIMLVVLCNCNIFRQDSIKLDFFVCLGPTLQYTTQVENREKILDGLNKHLIYEKEGGYYRIRVDFLSLKRQRSKVFIRARGRSGISCLDFEHEIIDIRRKIPELVRHDVLVKIKVDQ